MRAFATTKDFGPNKSKHGALGIGPAEFKTFLYNLR